MCKVYSVKCMKIAYLIGSLNRGGAETLLLDIFRKAEKAPFEMMVIHRKGGMYEQEFMQLKSQCVQLVPHKWRLLSYLQQLRKRLVDEHVTVIHAFYRLDVVYAWLATIGVRIPIVVTFHGYMGSECGWGMSLFYRVVMRLADKLCFVSGEQMKAYETRYGAVVRKKGVVLYNGIDFTKFDSIKPREDLTSEIGNLTFDKSSGIRLCMVGNFNSVRSQMVVCRALQKLKEKIEFYFVGGRYKGEEHYYDECVSYCKEPCLDNVHFFGTRNDVPAILKSMDGFVYSSRNDTFGIAVIEAIASGLPVVVNDHPVMKEVCGAPNAGIRYFRTDDAEDAAAQIDAMIVNIEQSKQAAKANAVAVRNKYSIQTHIERLSALYDEIEQKTDRQKRKIIKKIPL